MTVSFIINSCILHLLTPHHHLSTNICISQFVSAIDFISYVFNKSKKKEVKKVVVFVLCEYFFIIIFISLKHTKISNEYTK